MPRKRNEFTRSIDGVGRVTVSVSGRLTLMEVADQIAAHGYMNDLATYSAEEGFKPDVKMIRAVFTSRQAVMKMLQDCLWSYGSERAGCVIGDENLEGVREAVLTHLRTLWVGGEA